MKIDKNTATRGGIIWAIIVVVVSAILTLMAFSIDELGFEARVITVVMLGLSIIGLLLNLKRRKIQKKY